MNCRTWNQADMICKQMILLTFCLQLTRSEHLRRRSCRPNKGSSINVQSSFNLLIKWYWIRRIQITVWTISANWEIQRIKPAILAKRKIMRRRSIQKQKTTIIQLKIHRETCSQLRKIFNIWTAAFRPWMKGKEDNCCANIQ